MTLSTEEEQLIHELHFYQVNVRHYAYSSLKQNDRAMRHILEYLSLKLVVSEIDNAATHEELYLMMRRIHKSLVEEGIVTNDAYREIYRALQVLKDYCNWKRQGGQSADLQTLPEVAE